MPGSIREIVDIKCYNDFLFSMVKSGRLLAWDKTKAVSQKDRDREDFLLWVKSGKAQYLSVNNTKIVTLEVKKLKGGTSYRTVQLDFWDTQKKQEK